jgi:hypothetical protein
MSILSDFEERVGGALEGMFAGVFRSPVQPVEIAKALAKAMDDGRTVGVGKVYAPGSYTVALSPEDSEKFGAFTATLSGELATYLTDHAREHSYHLAGTPTITFVVHDDLRLGRFRVSAELAFADEEAHLPEPFTEDEEAEERAARAIGGLATVTVGESEHDVVLQGDEIVIGRLAGCDICLADSIASRRHARLVRTGEDWTLEDLDSTNGTMLNGVAVESKALHDGDVIEIGVTRLVFHRRGR